MRKVLLVILIVLFGSAIAQKPSVQLILDVSGSMWLNLESGDTKIDAAKTVLIDFIGGLPSDSLNMGLRLYGATVSGIDPQSCTDSQLIIPIDGLDKGGLINTVQSTDPKGGTPIVYALNEAIKDFDTVADDAQKLIILVTDGAESCGEDLDAAVQAVKAAGIDLQVIGFGLAEKAANTFESTGAFANAMSALELAAVLEETAQVIATAPVNSQVKNNEKIAFASDRDGNYEIYIMNPDGSNKERLTFNDTTDLGPSWSPDNKKLIFHSAVRNSEERVLNIMDVSSKQIKTVKFPIKLLEAAFAEWSPNGQEIVFRCTFQKNQHEICKSNIDGTMLSQLTNDFSLTLTPSWSPDGSKIIFGSNHEGNFEIYTMNPDGSNQKNISMSSSDDIVGYWSRDNSTIFFSSDRDGISEIYSMNPDGSSQKRITFNSVSDFGISPSSDSSKIVVINSVGSDKSKINILNLNSGEVTQLTSEVNSDLSPAWTNPTPQTNLQTFKILSLDGPRVQLANNSRSEFKLFWQGNPSLPVILDQETTICNFPNANCVTPSRVFDTMTNPLILNYGCGNEEGNFTNQIKLIDSQGVETQIFTFEVKCIK